MPAVSLDAADAEELAGFLLFLCEWAAADCDQLGESLARFMDDHPYSIDALLADLHRFKSLLGSDTENNFLPPDPLPRGRNITRCLQPPRCDILVPRGNPGTPGCSRRGGCAPREHGR